MYDELYVLQKHHLGSLLARRIWEGLRSHPSDGQETPGSSQGWSKLRPDHRRGVSSHHQRYMYTEGILLFSTGILFAAHVAQVFSSVKQKGWVTLF